MAVKAQWDRDTTHCCKQGCSRHRAKAKPGEPVPVMCQYHLDQFIARVEAIANAHEPPVPVATVGYRTPADDTDDCPRCGQKGARVDHGRAGC